MDFFGEFLNCRSLGVQIGSSKRPAALFDWWQMRIGFQRLLSGHAHSTSHLRTPMFDVIRPVVGASNFVFIDMRQRDFD